MAKTTKATKATKATAKQQQVEVIEQVVPGFEELGPVSVEEPVEEQEQPVEEPKVKTIRTGSKKALKAMYQNMTDGEIYEEIQSLADSMKYSAGRYEVNKLSVLSAIIRQRHASDRSSSSADRKFAKAQRKARIEAERQERIAKTRVKVEERMRKAEERLEAAKAKLAQLMGENPKQQVVHIVAE